MGDHRILPRPPFPRLPTDPGFWRSPLRGPWLTALLGVVLLLGITVLFVTGLLSYAAYNPDLAAPNDRTPDRGLLGFYLFAWPTDPYWLYRLTQGLHVTLGVVLVPVLLAKLWSVVPKLFTLPPARSAAHALERISLLLLVGGVLFEFVTGLLNVQLDYLFPGSFYPLHFYGAWVFISAFVVHVVLRLPKALQALRNGAPRDFASGGTADARREERAARRYEAAAERAGTGETETGEAGEGAAAGESAVSGGQEERSAAGEYDEGGEHDGAEEDDRPGARAAGGAPERAHEGAREPDLETGLVAPRPAAPTLTRRGALGAVGGGSVLLLAVTVGQNFDGLPRRTALLAPHGGPEPGTGANAFQINKTAAAVGVTDAETGAGWRLTLERPGGRTQRLSRADLLAMPQHSAALPIACVEGWSTSDQHWSGVRLSDLAELAGFDPRDGLPGVFVASLQRSGAFRHAALRDNQVRDPRSLLALRVGGEDLSLDHGYPARVIVPAAPGVHNTKWVQRLAFGADR
ncbi:molybdopterin-dependent oxidoreductase [Streptomyces qinglanensis]|uniref:Oxidoreductase molybdopterin binding domain-containing protein n=1 Tax=Streptomyces qinglanensis TaxID=943816 RepID=A0A1H9Q8C4_9ACTN|nr:molybdopterin-dependent oxidoreductase [Streptomyces qinglanensis]SER56694.1 Oxidoreductase molybdopterin binding domain-containing protein [Streptomyces qinglanensis]